MNYLRKAIVRYIFLMMHAFSFANAQNYYHLTFQCDSNNVLQSYFNLKEPYKEYTAKLTIEDTLHKLWFEGELNNKPITLVSGVYKVSIDLMLNEQIKYHDVTYVIVPEQAKAIMTFDRLVSCIGVPVVFINNSIGNGLVSELEWGDGVVKTVGKGEKLVHEFVVAQSYAPVLIVTDKYSCSDKTTELLEVYKNFLYYNLKTNQSLENGKAIELYLEPEFNATHIEKYIWSTGDTTQNLKVMEEGSYQVIIKDKYGCEKTLSTQVLFTEVLATKLKKTNYNKKEKQLELQAESREGVAYKWQTKKGKHLQLLEETNAVISLKRKKVKVRVAAYTSEQGKISSYEYSNWYKVRKNNFQIID